MEQSKKKYKRRGISLKLLSWIISVFVFIISSTLIVSLALISYENKKVTQSYNNYIYIKQASSDVQMASDYLTDQVRLFVVNANKKYMDAYFEEADVTKRREKALEKVHELAKQTSRHEEIHICIEKAVDESMDLMNLEFFAMKLICVDESIPYSEYPEVANADISEVLPENRKSEALNAVLGNKYVLQKDKISEYINEAFDIIDELILHSSMESSSTLRRLIAVQTVIIIMNILFAIAVILLLFFLIIRPMNKAFHSIEANREVETYGNREFNYIIDAYNDIHSQNESVKENLKYEAEHDKLTNLYNRTAYVSLYKRIKLSRALYLLIDADGFKDVNDKYGHDVGDKLLIRIARVLERHFSEDNAFVFRLGGDEFAVLIDNVYDVVNRTIVERCEKINEELSHAEGDIPAISLSIGVAHGDEKDTTDTLFKKADKVLYKVKQSGKSGVIYEQY